MNMKYYIGTVFLFFFINYIYSQPGPSSGKLEFKVYDKEGNAITPNNKIFKIDVENINEKDTFFYSEPYYKVIPFGTPMGGYVSRDFNIIIKCETDTMIIYPPNFGDNKIKFDSIPFNRGIYKIPEHIYYFDNLKLPLKVTTYPSIYNDWCFFKLPQPNIYIELVKELPMPEPWEIKKEKYFKKFSTPILIQHSDREIYYFSDLILVKDSNNYYKIYKIKDIVDKSLFQESNVYDFRCDTIFYTNDTYYAVGFRNVGIGGTVQEIYGEFKLHFDDNLTENQIFCLKYKFHQDIKRYVNEKLQLGLNTEIFINKYNEYLDEFKQNNLEIKQCKCE